MKLSWRPGSGRKFIGLLFGMTAAMFSLAASPGSSSLRVSNLTCGGMHNPLGVDSPPLLAWQLESVTRGEYQTAWQIQVAHSAAALASGKPDVWDSGRVPGSEQLQIPYRGPALRTGEQVHWRVRAWNRDKQASPWSDTASWTMGVVATADWRAQWITDPELLKVTRTKVGFSTPPVRDENTPAWITVDLGRAVPIDSIVLDALVHTVPERIGFPRWFKVELAEDASFANATIVADHTKEGINVWLDRIAVPVAKISARYVRLTVTRLRMIDEKEEGFEQGRLALQQIEIYSGGTNVAVGGTVTASASLEDGPWSAASVVDGMEIPGANPRAADTLLVRHEFAIRPAIRRALLFVTGLGTYTVSLNGSAVAPDDLLTPGWTNPEHTIFYDTRDVTALLHPGTNAIALTIAGGMYNVAAVPGRYTKFVSAPRALVAFAQLRLEYANGTTETIASGDGWRTSVGPVTFAHMYGGEDYDPRLEPHGWDRPGFDDANWRKVVVVPGPGGSLRGSSEAAPPIRAEATLPVLSSRELKPGVTVFDLGQNAAVMPRLRVRGVAGATVKISPAELLAPDGSIDPRSTRPKNSDASWNYTLAGTGNAETWQPRFFYHGARYLQVQRTAPEGAALPTIEHIEAVVVHSDSPPAGEFTCSDELFCRIATLVRWAQRNNLAHVLTDCPHRERLGWLEQYHLNGPSLRYNFDLGRLYRKGFTDMSDAQRETGLVPDIAPEYVQFNGGFANSPEWGSSIILAAWQQFVWTADEASLRRHYGAMRRYFAFLSSRAHDHILDFGLGDWYDIGPNPPGVAQLTPIALTATAIYYEDALALRRIAEQIGKAADAAEYRETATAIKAAFNRHFFNATNSTYATGSQTANAMPLVLGLVPEGQTEAVAGHLVDDVQSHGDAFTAGDVGYRFLLRALAGADRSDVVFAMNNQCSNLGYGFQLAHGATSLTEAWDANPHSSQDHFMLGQIVEWFYGNVAGLAPDPGSPGFGRVLVRPSPVGDLLWAQARYHSVRGPIEVQWRKEAGLFFLEVTVPANSRALVELPVGPKASVLESGRPADQSAGVHRVTTDAARQCFEVASGRYRFEATN